MEETKDYKTTSDCCNGEKCYCGLPAKHKIEEVIFDDMQPRHPYNNYVCDEHFMKALGRPPYNLSYHRNAGHIVLGISAHGKACNGCKDVNKDIMLTYNCTLVPTEIVDIFLSTKQAEDLLEELQKRLRYNKEI